jgi:hypothetical protein
LKSERLITILAVCAFLVSIPAARFGQAVHFVQIQERITDSSGAVVPGAKTQATQGAFKFAFEELARYSNPGGGCRAFRPEITWLSLPGSKPGRGDFRGLYKP